jgi:hypothetical protein
LSRYENFNEATAVTKNPHFLNTEEAAKFLGKAPGTLVVWRSTKRYDLPYIKIGGSIRYDMDDLIAFVESQRVEPVGAQ